MTFNLSKKTKLLIRGCFAVLFLSAGLLVRVSNLDGKFYWIDEVSSSFVITGHWPESIEVESEKTSGELINVGKFQQLLEKSPNADSAQLITSLLERDPQHSPLYFILVQQWAGFFGASPKSLRMASSLLTFIGVPVFAWLCFELFGSYLFSLVGLGILALAPFNILFSQQNREYGFWFTVCALSTVLLLLAHRRATKRYWIAYGISVAVSLYTFLFSLPFLLCHFFFSWFETKSGEDRRFKTFMWSVGLGIFAYVPWLANIALHREQVEDLNSWSSMYLEPKLYIQGLILNFSRLFVDFNLPSFKPLPTNDPVVMVSISIVCGIIVMALYLSTKRLSVSKRTLVLSMLLIPFLFLFSLDLWHGQGIHALVGRQLMPAWMSVYLAVTFLIGTGLQSKIIFKKCVAGGCALVLVAFGVCFAANYIPANYWWPLRPKTLLDEASLIERSRVDLLVTTQPTDTKQFISLSYSLRPELPLLMLKDHRQVPDLGATTTVALYQPSGWLLEVFRGNFDLKKVGDSLWLGRRIGH